jgi:hypothetical protein
MRYSHAIPTDPPARCKIDRRQVLSLKPGNFFHRGLSIVSRGWVICRSTTIVRVTVASWIIDPARQVFEAIELLLGA